MYAPAPSYSCLSLSRVIAYVQGHSQHMSIELHINGIRTEGPEGASLFESAERLDIRVPTSCLKQGKCRECMVEVVEGMELLSPRTPQESHLPETFRLSCRTLLAADAGTVRCHTLRRGEMRVERQAYRLPIQAKQLTPEPAVTRQGDRIFLDDEEIAVSTAPILGVAVDIGTTTVVVRLLNLETGEVIADTSFENPQRFGGSDVMARIQFDTNNRGRLLQRTLTGYLSHAIEDFGVDPQTIYEMAVVGNSTMRDLFFGLDVYSIGQSPYRSITEPELHEGKRTSTSLTATPRRLSLPMHPKGRIYGLPIISGHIGADTAACMLAIDIAHEDRLVALMDIGTNTELVLGNRHRQLAASCPAGPAFEGGRISFGMPGLPGAIEHATMHADGSFSTTVIGDSTPEGICGSGLIDILSELLRTGRMNSLGRFEHDGSRVLVQETTEGDISITESDVNELAQAKGANVAGLHVIFNEYGTRYDDVEVFYLAGGFGRHIDIASAKRIGLIPDIGESRIVQVGNAAIEGACIALLSRSKRAELERLISQVGHCRLESDPEFFNYFVEGCQFNPVSTIGSTDLPGQGNGG